MATDTDDLILSISADVRQMQRALQRLTGETDRAVKTVQRQFDDMSSKTSGALDNTAASARRAFTVIEGGAQRVNAAMQTSKLQTANLAAQLNDIAVQLAGGQSPFQIALQQGTQINQILGANGVRGAVSMLGAAFTSLINPVSLATIAIIGLGGTAIQYFTSLINEGEKSEETLRKQEELVKRVADRWGEAIPAIKEYAKERERISQQAELSEVKGIVKESYWQDVRNQIRDARLELADLVTMIPKAAETQDDVVAVQRAFEALEKAIKEGRATTEDLQRVQDALSQLFAVTSIPVVGELADQFGNLAGAIDQAAAATERLDNLSNVEQRLDEIKQKTAAFIEEEKRRQGLTAEQLRLENEIARVRREAERAGGWLTDDQARDIALGNLAADDRRSSERRTSLSSGRSSRVSQIERERQAVIDLIDALEHEYRLIGATDTERRIANELRRAGAAATDEQRERIRELVLAIEEEREALKRSEEEMKAVEEVGRDFLVTFIGKLREGASASEALSAALQKVADKLLDMALNNLVERALGGLKDAGSGGGGLLGGIIIPGILHSGGVAGRDGYGHGRAVSPAVFAGATRYHSGGIAGLRPDEVPAILQKGEVVLPKGAKVGAPSMAYSPSYVIDARGADAGVEEKIRKALKEYDKGNIQRFQQAVQHMRKHYVMMGV